ncbi:MAG: DUF1652 domain-containing protein [Pseudomonas sp.]
MSVMAGPSALELRAIIEAAFLPDRCVTAVVDERSMAITIYEGESDIVKVAIVGVELKELTTMRAISKFVLDVKSGLTVAAQIEQTQRA